jgi:hypothetical protein
MYEPSLFEYYPVSQGQVDAAAEDTRARVARITKLKGQVDAQHQAALAAIEGDIEASVANADDTITTNADAVHQKAEYAAGCLEYFGKAIEKYDYSSSSPRSISKLNSAYAIASRNTFGINYSDYEADPGASQADRDTANTRYSTAVGNARSQLIGELTTEKKQLDAQLDDDADEVSSMLHRGPNAADIRTMYEAGALPGDAALVFANVSGVDFAHWTLDPQKAAELGEQLAKQIKDGDIDPEDVQLLSINHANPAFAQALYENVTPSEMADAVMDLSHDAFPGPEYTGMFPEEAKLYHDFLVAAGLTLATYGNGTGQYAPPADFAKQWSDAICSEEPGDQENAAALSMLFKYGQDGKFDADFLADVTSNVYEYERSKGGNPVWGPRVGLGENSSSYYGPYDPIEVNGIWQYRQSYDPLANLFMAMNESPHAAEKFFASGTDTDFTPTDSDDPTGTKINDRLQYLLRDRIWPTDNGDGLGQLLEGATTGTRDHGDQGKADAKLASELVHVIVNQTGKGDDIWDDGWRIPTDMRDSVGNILASYVSDIDRIAQNGSGDPAGPGNLIYGDDPSEDGDDPYGIAATNKDMATVLQEIGRGDDKSGIQAVVTAEILHNKDTQSEIVAAYNASHPGNPKTIDDLRANGVLDDLTDEASRFGTTISFVMDNGISGGHAQESDNAARQAMLAKGFSVATSFIPGPEGKILGPLTSNAIGLMNDAISEVPDSVTDAWAKGTDKASKTAIEYNTYDMLIQNGYLDQNVDPTYGVPTSAVVYDSNGHPRHIDPRLYDADGNNPPSDTAQNQFNDWQNGPEPAAGDNNGSPNSIFQEYINAYSSWITHP